MPVEAILELVPLWQFLLLFPFFLPLILWDAFWSAILPWR